MNLLQAVRLRIDQRFRPKRFAEILLGGVRSQLLGAPNFLKEYLDRQKAEASEDREYWKQRRDHVRALLDKLHEFGFRSPEDYLFHDGGLVDDDADLEILNLIRDIRNSEITTEGEGEICASLEKYDSEIEACEKILSDVERISAVVATLKAQSVVELENVFRQNECAYLLSMPTIIDVEKIIREHYCQ